MENARAEISQEAVRKGMGWKMREWKNRHGVTGVENAGLKNACMVISKLNIGIHLRCTDVDCKPNSISLFLTFTDNYRHIENKTSQTKL